MTLTPEEITALQEGKKTADAELARLREENDKLKKPPDKKNKEGEEGDDPEGEDLATKARKDAEAAENAKSKSKTIERALKFDMGLADFAKSNKGLIPAEFEGILDRASRETFDDVIAKTQAIKSSFLTTFFTIAQNHDQLTASQKESVDGFLKLTKTGKEKEAEKLYETIFEPALESLKRVRKAEQLNRARQGLSDGGSSVMNDYKDRIIKQSESAYQKKKKGA